MTNNFKEEFLLTAVAREEFKQKMLNWADRFGIFCFLDNSNYSFSEPAFDFCMAAGTKNAFAFSGENDFSKLSDFHKANPTHLFGHIGYESGMESARSPSSPALNFGPGYFFEPEILITAKAGLIFIESACKNPTAVFEEISNVVCTKSTVKSNVQIEHSLSREEYLKAINDILTHIRRGDCYELNFCQSFQAAGVTKSAAEIFLDLQQLSPAPFASLYRHHAHYCLCASPERFLQKTGNRIISQPMKGTSPRDHDDPAADQRNRNYLLSNAKERAENIMVTDLVRNDLSYSAAPASVEVEELCGVYSFPRVHQMISTVCSTLKSSANFTDVLRDCFPAGSMTGAPKKRVMELIDRYEPLERGLFSGCIGYIAPDADFDFNVVIRSIFLNTKSFEAIAFAGSGITIGSDPEAEYEECMLKAEALLKVIG